MSEEVRYPYLRPAQIRERREACPVAYIPIGTIEWHGFHLPTGVDSIQAEGLAILCAQNGGGMAFPPLWYGESRVEALMEANAADRDQIAEGMGLSPDNFTPERMPFPATEQALNYHKLLVHILTEVETLGFKLGVIIAGHYPLIDHARAAVLQFNKREFSRKKGMLAWTCLDYMLITDRYPDAGDHAGHWETSHTMALQPDTVDLDTLPDDPNDLIGVSKTKPPHKATAEFGRETLEASAEAILKEVQHRQENDSYYRGHGRSLEEGRWKKS